MRAGLLSLVKSMGWEAEGESTSWISSCSAGEKKGRKLMRVSAPASLSKTNRNYEHLYRFSTSNGVSIPSLPLPHNQASLELVLPGLPLAALASPPPSFGRMPLWPIIWDSKQKGFWKRGTGNLHTQWNYLISHDSFTAFFQILISLFW